MARRYLLADFSNNNASVNLCRVKDAGIVGFWHKVTEGTSFTDKDWAIRRDQGRKIGLRVGGYHFASPDTPFDAEREAVKFVDHLGPLHRQDLAPVLDLEQAGKLAPSQLDKWARAWMHKTHELLGVWPLFYSYPSFIMAMKSTRVIGRGLWLASYARNDGSEHPYIVPPPFRKALAHQFTSNAKIIGVMGHCDLSSAPKLYPLLARGLRGL